MTPRLKKLVGLLIWLPYVFIYLFAAAAIGDHVPPHWALKLLYFALAGVIWVFPLKYLMNWMNAAPKVQTKSKASETGS
ncbi:MAG: DUF2842 domain-containing protein [Parvularculaceae bacterium]|nr:MAG: DUF2842 domain-containing protein [Parvularculaceae bacterium]